MVDRHETDGRIETERVDMAKTTPSKRVMTSRCHHACPPSLKQASKSPLISLSSEQRPRWLDGALCAQQASGVRDPLNQPVL